MSKTAKAKSRQPSIHSRAARRATSPSINTDKSLKELPSLPSKRSTTHIFSSAAQNAGIRKKPKKQLKRNQLSRQKRGLERADVVKEQLDMKLMRSMGRLKTIKERRKDWEVINGENTSMSGLAEGGAVGSGRFGLLDGWVDVNDEDDGEESKDQSGSGDQVMQLELPVRTLALDTRPKTSVEERVQEPPEEHDVVE